MPLERVELLLRQRLFTLILPLKRLDLVFKSENLHLHVVGLFEVHAARFINIRLSFSLTRHHTHT